MGVLVGVHLEGYKSHLQPHLSSPEFFTRSLLLTQVLLHTLLTMRLLSFVPAFLLAAASFVVAAPNTSGAVGTSPSPSTGGGSDACLQDVITILADTTDAIKPLNVKLSTFQLFFI